MKRRTRGFTLIELSIVLIIIGLIVGGVLVGQNLIQAAEVRAQITQIEKYNSAVNTFRGKFNAIPGDMRPEIAQQFNFTLGTNCDGSIQGRRNGDGIIDGGYGQSCCPLIQRVGETALFWMDVSSAAAGNLIDTQIPNGGASFNCTSGGAVPQTGLGQYYPSAKIGHGHYVYVYEYSGANWYGLSAVTGIDSSNNMLSNSTLPVLQAYAMDQKVDDGNPLTGNIVAMYLNADGGLLPPSFAPHTTTSGGTTSSCYDTTTSTYSVTMNNGNGGNCALSFRFQ